MPRDSSNTGALDGAWNNECQLLNNRVEFEINPSLLKPINLSVNNNFNSEEAYILIKDVEPLGLNNMSFREIMDNPVQL